MIGKRAPKQRNKASNRQALTAVRLNQYDTRQSCRVLVSRGPPGYLTKVLEQTFATRPRASFTPNHLNKEKEKTQRKASECVVDRHSFDRRLLYLARDTTANKLSCLFFFRSSRRVPPIAAFPLFELCIYHYRLLHSLPEESAPNTIRLGAKGQISKKTK